MCNFFEVREIIPCFYKENLKRLVAVMKTYKTLFITLFMVITLSGFPPLSIAQEVGREDMFDEYYDGLDYDEGNVGHSATIYFYSRGLSATGNDNPQLSNGKVAPESGDSSTQFYYSVDYSDSNGDAPTTISVYIDDASSTLTLNSGVASSGTYKSAAITLGLQAHTYYFTAEDGNGGSARLPASGSISGPGVSNASLSNGKAEPGTGTSSSEFFYEVTYNDPDEGSPSGVYVYIDGTPSSMTLESGSAYNGTYKSSAQKLDSGTHNYYFTAIDEEEVSIRLPASGTYSGPTINDPPQLSEGKVTPDPGNSSTDFYYYVECNDKEGDVLKTYYIYIDDEAYEMSLYSGVSYNGTYQYGPKMLKGGSHDFYFSFTDEHNNVGRLPVSGSYSGPTINDPPQLSGGKVVPDSGNSSTDFYYYVEYYDGEEDTPGTPYIYIDNVAYVMSLYSGVSYNGTYRYGPKLFKEDGHDFYFSFGDGYNDIVRLPSEGSYSGPEMTSGAIYVYDNVGGASIILDGSDSGYTTPATLSPVNMGVHKVALLKSNYVSLPPYAVVKVTQNTVEVPFILLPCPAVVALKGESDHLGLLRDFRDSTLSQTEKGREYVDLYYAYASEISLIMMNDSEVKSRMERLLYQLIPFVTPLMERGDVILPSEMKDEIVLLLDEFEAEGSPFLKAAMKRIRKELNGEEIFKDMGFEIEGDSLQVEEE